MKLRFFLLICVVFLLSFGIAYSSTIITGDAISANTLNLTSGNFFQGASALSEIGYIQDDSSNGGATGIQDVRGVSVLGKYAYLAGKSDNALSIIDISDPTNMSEVGVIFDDSVGGNAVALQKPVAVYVSGKYAYVATATDDSISIIDISNPANLTEVGYISDDSRGGTATRFNTLTGVYVSGEYAYVISRDDNALSVIDISDPTNPLEISYIVIPGGPTGLYVSGSYAYVASQSSSSLSIIDISNPANLIEVGYISDDSFGGDANYLWGAEAVYVLGSYAYVKAKEDDSLSIIDVSNFSNLVEVGYIQDDSWGGNATALEGFAEIYVSGDYAYVTSLTEGALSVFDVSDVTNIFEVSVLQDDSMGGNATHLAASRGLFVSGKYAYVASRDDNAFTVVEAEKNVDKKLNKK